MVQYREKFSKYGEVVTIFWTCRIETRGGKAGSRAKSQGVRTPRTRSGYVRWVTNILGFSGGTPKIALGNKN